MDRGAWWATVRGVANSRTRMSTHTISNPYAMYDVLSHGMAGNSILMFLILFLFRPIDMAFPIRGGAHSRGILCKPVRYPVLSQLGLMDSAGEESWVLGLRGSTGSRGVSEIGLLCLQPSGTPAGDMRAKGSLLHMIRLNAPQRSSWSSPCCTNPTTEKEILQWCLCLF